MVVAAMLKSSTPFDSDGSIWFRELSSLSIWVLIGVEGSCGSSCCTEVGFDSGCVGCGTDVVVVDDGCNVGVNCDNDSLEANDTRCETTVCFWALILSDGRFLVSVARAVVVVVVVVAVTLLVVEIVDGRVTWYCSGSTECCLSSRFLDTN